MTSKENDSYLAQFFIAGEPNSITNMRDRFLKHCEEQLPNFTDETRPIFIQLLGMYKAQKILNKELVDSCNEVLDKHEQGYTLNQYGEWIKPN